jgi:hypothetical protein
LGCGTDHDFLLPAPALPVLWRLLADRWPEGVVALPGASRVPLAILHESSGEALGDGFVVARDAGALERFFERGAYRDEDGEAPLNVFLVGGDADVHVDLVFEPGPDTAFVFAVHALVGQATAGFAGPSDDLWVRAARAALGLGEEDEAVVRGLWHRVRHGVGGARHSRPPGRLLVREGRIELAG